MAIKGANLFALILNKFQYAVNKPFRRNKFKPDAVYHMRTNLGNWIRVLLIYAYGT